MRQIKLDKGIKTLQRKWFRSLVQLKVLSLKEIEINDIEDDAFNDSQFESLEELGFFRTPIQFLREGTFNGLKNLLKLRFSAVNFIGFSKNVLATVPKLTTLIIERCGSKKLMIDNLFGSNPIRNLINLRIIECNLKDTITESTFKSLKGIISLSLSQNRIERIGNRSFDIIFPTLRHLHLGWNGMKSLGGKLFKTRGRQFPIQISANGNPWHCDCELESFRQRIKKTNLKFDNITCLTPPENAGVILNFANSLCVESIRSVDLTHNVSDIGSRLLCEKLNDMRENVPLRLTKDETEIRIRTRNDRLFIDTLHFSNDFNLIGFEERKLRNGEKIQKCLANIKSNNVQSLRFDQELRLNRFYQFCSKRRESNMIAPLNCISFYSGDLPKFADGLMSTDVWIMIDDKSISIIAFVLCPIFAFIIGISSLFILAKWFMWTFQARDGNLMEKEKASTVHEYEAIKRFRFVSPFHILINKI